MWLWQPFVVYVQHGVEATGREDTTSLTNQLEPRHNEMGRVF